MSAPCKCDPCIAVAKEARRLRVSMLCAWCGTPVHLVDREASTAKQRGRAHCSRACAVAYSAEVSRQTLARINRATAGARMRARNPMRLASAREKMSATLRRIGHTPKVRGGNGRPVSAPQQRLADALGWPTEVVVAVGRGRGAGWPSHYKIDIACAQRKIAIEVDGGSHSSVKVRAADARKAAFLEEQGWTVWRFSNADAMENTSVCVQTVLSGTSR